MRLWPVYHTSSLPLLPPQSEAPHTCSSTGSFPCDTVHHKLLQCGTPSHEIQLFMNCSSQCLPQGNRSCQQACSQSGLLFPWRHRSCKEPAPAWASMGSQSHLGPHLLSTASVKCRGSFCQVLTESTPAATLYHNHTRQTSCQISWSSRRDLFRNHMNFLIWSQLSCATIQETGEE